MTSHFYLSRRLTIALALNAAAPAVLAFAYLLDEPSWWRRIIAAVFVLGAVVNGYLLRRAMAAPLVSISPTEIVERAWWHRSGRKIPRSEIQQVAWSNADTICLRLRSGEDDVVGLGGLSRPSKDAVLAELESSDRVRA